VKRAIARSSCAGAADQSATVLTGGFQAGKRRVDLISGVAHTQGRVPANELVVNIGGGSNPI